MGSEYLYSFLARTVETVQAYYKEIKHMAETSHIEEVRRARTYLLQYKESTHTIIGILGFSLVI